LYTQLKKKPADKAKTAKINGKIGEEKRKYEKMREIQMCTMHGAK